MSLPLVGLPVVGLHGAPRSGTTWLGQILNSAPQVAFRFQPFFAHAFRARVDACRTASDLEAVLADIAVTEDDFILQRGARRLAHRDLAFAKAAPTRLAYKEVRYHHLLPRLMRIEGFMGVGIVRDPLDVLTSWVNAPREFDPAWDFAAEWRAAPAKNAGRVEEFYGYDGWKRTAEVFEAMVAAHPGRFRIVRYEDLTADPMRGVADLFDFLRLEMGPQVRDFVARSTSADDGDPYGVFRSGERRPRLQPVTPRVRDWIVEDMRRAGLDRYLA